MSAVTLVTAEMRACVGGLLEVRHSPVLDASDVRRWLMAVYHPEPPPAPERDAVDGAELAPYELNPFAWSQERREHAWDDPDRIESCLGVPGPRLPNMLNGGISVQYGARLRVGDSVTSEERLVSYTERQGRLGLMLFTTCEQRWVAQDGRWIKTLRTTLIRY
jgi:hypothetical protein